MKISNKDKYSKIFDHEKRKQVDTEGYCIFEPNKYLSEWLGTELNFLRDKINTLLEIEAEHSESKNIILKSGSIVVLNCNICNKGGKNLSGERRRLINVIYRKRNLKQSLCQKKNLSKETISVKSYEQKKLFKVLNVDNGQEEKIFGSGNKYKQWLLKKPKFNYSKSNDLTNKHY